MGMLIYISYVDNEIYELDGGQPRDLLRVSHIFSYYLRRNWIVSHFFV